MPKRHCQTARRVNDSFGRAEYTNLPVRRVSHWRAHIGDRLSVTPLVSVLLPAVPNAMPVRPVALGRAWIQLPDPAEGAGKADGRAASLRGRPAIAGDGSATAVVAATSCSVPRSPPLKANVAGEGDSGETVRFIGSSGGGVAPAISDAWLPGPNSCSCRTRWAPGLPKAASSGKSLNAYRGPSPLLGNVPKCTA